MAEPTLIELVRDRTTDDVDIVSDAKIERYLELHGDEWRLAAADILDYLARDDVYETYARGQIRAAKPLLHSRANELRAEVLGAIGVSATSATLARGDYGTTDATPEYLIQHPPYTYGTGLMKTLKEDAGV